MHEVAGHDPMAPPRRKPVPAVVAARKRKKDGVVKEFAATTGERVTQSWSKCGGAAGCRDQLSRTIACFSVRG